MRLSAKFRKQLVRMENMVYDADEDCFFCANGRKLPLRRECAELQNGREVTTAYYRCCGKSAARQRIWSGQKNCARSRGKTLRPSAASICACAAPFRWKALEKAPGLSLLYPKSGADYPQLSDFCAEKDVPQNISFCDTPLGSMGR